MKHGVLDRRLVRFFFLEYPFSLVKIIQGTADKNAFCETCGLNSVNCVGHYAYIKLVVPVFHIGYFKHTIAVLQSICKVCYLYTNLSVLFFNLADVQRHVHASS